MPTQYTEIETLGLHRKNNRTTKQINRPTNGRTLGLTGKAHFQ